MTCLLHLIPRNEIPMEKVKTFWKGQEPPSSKDLCKLIKSYIEDNKKRREAKREQEVKELEKKAHDLLKPICWVEF